MRSAHRFPAASAIRGLLLGIALAVPALGAPAAAAAAAASPPAAKATYAGLLQKARLGDRDLDYTALRMAWADPASGQQEASRDLRDQMFGALHASQWQAVIDAATRVLDADYLDIDAHMFVAVAYDKTHQPDKAAHHRLVGSGLLHSILASGDGRTPDTAMVVIAVDEEYSVLRSKGLMPGSQDLVHAKEHGYDHLVAQNPETHQQVELWFQIDRVLVLEDLALKAGSGSGSGSGSATPP